jgi:hypothetical protein
MGSAVLSVMVNGLMAALLFATIIYCSRLNKRIRVLQDSRSELARIIREFNESTERATQSIADIHEATNRISENIQHKIDRANYLATDLDLMIEKGSKLAGLKPEPARVNPAPASAPAAPRPARSEHAMSAAQGNVSGVAQKADTPLEPARARPGNRPRSRAEQELMNVLKNDGR